jgi:hypothetical protein
MRRAILYVIVVPPRMSEPWCPAGLTQPAHDAFRPDPAPKPPEGEGVIRPRRRWHRLPRDCARSTNIPPVPDGNDDERDSGIVKVDLLIFGAALSFIGRGYRLDGGETAIGGGATSNDVLSMRLPAFLAGQIAMADEVRLPDDVPACA